MKISDSEKGTKPNSYAYEFNIDQPTTLRIQFSSTEICRDIDDLMNEVSNKSDFFNQKILQIVPSIKNDQPKMDLAKTAVSGLLGGIM